MDKKDGPFFTNRPRQGGMYMPFSEENVLDFVKWLLLFKKNEKTFQKE